MNSLHDRRSFGLRQVPSVALKKRDINRKNFRCHPKAGVSEGSFRAYIGLIVIELVAFRVLAGRQSNIIFGNSTPMCILAIQYRLVPDAPILVAMNREERYDRPTVAPAIQSGKPRILCGVDQQASGTWLGVNQHGLFVAACNRHKPNAPLSPRSRGLLCREILRAGSARQAVDMAMDELSIPDKYAGVNFVVADAESGWVVHGGEELEAVQLEEGLTIVCNGDANDPRDERAKLAKRLLTLQTLDSPVKFLAVASKVFARAPAGPDRPNMIVRNSDGER